MKEKLLALGWKCSLCNCPGIKGYDCANADHKGYVIQERGTRFKIIKNSMVIESAHAYEFDEKMKANGLIT